jgi:hypothetical protein
MGRRWIGIAAAAGLTWIAVSRGAAVPALAREEPAPSVTFEKVYYLTDENAFDKVSGTFTMGATTLDYHSDRFDLHVPVSALRGVTIGRMKKDTLNDWALVEYEEAGAKHVAGFRDGKNLGYGADTVAIHDAVRVKILATRGPGEAKPAPADAAGAAPAAPSAPFPFELFKAEVKKGFPPAPKTLVTDPNIMGLVLVDGTIKQGVVRSELTGLGLTLQGGDLTVWRGGTAGRSMRNVVVFTGLEPGVYRIRLVQATSSDGALSFEAPPHSDLTLSVEAGRIDYVGTLVFNRKPQVVEIERTADAERESDVLKWFVEKYAGSPWASIAQDRLKALEPAK